LFDRIRERGGAASYIGVQPLNNSPIEMKRAARGVLRLLERGDDLAGQRDFRHPAGVEMASQGLDLTGMNPRLASVASRYPG
jgi:hypothetical protein